MEMYFSFFVLLCDSVTILSDQYSPHCWLPTRRSSASIWLVIKRVKKTRIEEDFNRIYRDMTIVEKIMSCFASNALVDSPSRGSVPRRFYLSDPQNVYAEANGSYTPTNATTTIPRSHLRTRPRFRSPLGSSCEHWETGKRWKPREEL